ncbi:MAG: hypothetical protein V3R65_00770 [Acidiferrobacterales bacterium]
MKGTQKRPFLIWRDIKRYIITRRGVVINIELTMACRLVCVIGVVVLVFANQPLYASKDSVAQQQRRAMGFARSGQHQRALMILQSLKNKYPNQYSVQRDYILVASWMGECDRVIDGYRGLQYKYQHFSRVAVAAAKCLRTQNRVRDAIQLLETALGRNKGNRELKQELVAAQQELSAQNFTTEYALETNNSDAGNREWRVQAMVWGEITDRLYGHARLTMIHAIDPQFATGDLNRVGVGLDYDVGKISLDGEVSSDVIRSGETGLSTIVRYTPKEAWKLTAAYHSFSEEVPLRAKALNITGNQRHIGASFHTPDYAWEWLAAMDWLDFSDGNRRHEWFSELGYGLDLKPEREKRLMFELSQSSNSLVGTSYFNPLSAQTLIVGYKLTRVHKSQYNRKTDELYSWLGSYQQQTFGSHTIYGLRYEQNIVFDETRSLMWFVAAASKVYDGNREIEIKAGLHYTRELE